MILEDQSQQKVYSDGQETERRMLEIARNYPEEASEAVISGSYDYTTNNTFSSVRRNLLNWYPFQDHATALEIGAGMGALTGLLCDRCSHVTALEMNENRAAVIRARYPERKNLQILVGDLNHLELPEKFDYVVFVGVLEYAALFSDVADPFTEFLRVATSFLKPDGRLLFAIENQYGLKYWCGAAEDHLQQPFAGIAGYEAPRTARTFSRAALERLLRNVGLDHQRFYAALPDYKFPTMLFADEWKPSGSDLTNIAYTYGQNSLLVADERKLYAELAENGVVAFFANSFFVEASAVPLAEAHPVLITARGENLPEYRVVTTVTSDHTIQKQAASPQAQAHLLRIAENERTLEARGVPVLKMQMENGRLVRPLSDLPRADAAFRSCLRRGDMDGVQSLTEALRTALLKSSELSDRAENALTRGNIASIGEDFGSILKDGYLDMAFYNAFLDGTDLVFFDQEWRIQELPVEFILYYAIKCIYARGSEGSLLSQDEVLTHLGIASAHRPLYDQLENALWSQLFVRQGDLYGARGYCTQYANTNKLAFVTDRLAALTQENERLQTDLQCKNSHIELLLQSERNLLSAVKQKDDAIAQQSATLTEKEQTIGQQITALEEKERALCNKDGHIALLLESDRELARIKSSRSWRFMGYVWKLRDSLVPKGSKRRLLGKMLVKFLKHPLYFLSKCTPHKISKFFKVLRHEGTEGTSRRLDDCLIGNAIPEQVLILEPVKPIAEKSAADYPPLTVPQWAEPQVSIVIPVYNQFDYTYACVKSILSNSGNISYEILIADDCSTDLTGQIDQIISGLHTIRNQKNLRFLLNCNHAAEAAKGKYILFLNNDTQVQENWLEPLVHLMEQDDTIGMTGSKLVYPDGRLQEAGGIFWNDASAWNYGNRSDPTAPEYNYVKDVDYISGAAICIRRTLWEEIGGFDQRFVPAYCEDSDLAFEVRKRGYRVVYQPLSVVVHFEGVSNGTDTSAGQKRYQIVNQKKFYEKWKIVLESEHFPNGENVFLARDRSRNKKTVVVVDHYIPTYDKDAGSRTVDQYLRLLVEAGYNVKLIGDNFYCNVPYARRFEQMGIEILYGVYYRDHWQDWVRENAAAIDFVFLNRPHITIKYIDFFKVNTRAKVIYYGHDLHFLRESREYKLTGDLALKKSSDKWKAQELGIMSKADVVFTLSTDERKLINEELHEEKAIISPIFYFRDFPCEPVDLLGRRDIIFVGGFNHHPNEDGVLWFINAMWAHIRAALPGVRLVIIGSNPTEKISALASKDIFVTGYITDEELEDYYRKSRLCIIPLRFGAGVKGKTIEAMYHRIPVVTTSIGTEGLPKIDNYLPSTDEESAFVQRVLSLYQDDDAAQKEADGYCDYLRGYFSYKSAKELFLQVFSKEETK